MYKDAVLDVTLYKQKGVELAKEIEQAVRATQSLIIRPLPSQLVVTLDQYKDLMVISGLIHLIGDDDTGRLYKTKYNVMEVYIKNGNTETPENN